MPKAKKKPLPLKKSLPIKKTPASPKKTSKNLWMLILAIANVIGYIAVVIINYQAVNLPIGGMTTGQLSDLYPNLFTPAGLTFSIRGLIYLALLGFVVWQLIDVTKKNSHRITQKIGPRFLLSCAANIGWIFAWHYQQILLSVIVMIIFLITLIIISYKVQVGKKLGTWKEKFLVQVPFSLYQGRLSVAIIANIAARLVHIGWGMRGMTPIFWTITMIIVATLLTFMQLYKKNDIIFALVVLRAFIGIIIKTLGAEIVYTNIIWTLGICSVSIATLIGGRWEMWKKN